ncbi:hypothetical protein GA0070624_0685 [Micromonospora rhizosphaerae]|uniref:EcsC protein family protein n=1 Tax=Micromonospora rhizosphaerae TaxID=568872 RepID=A0A1C6RDT8_9ACTN|nr:hypothetical protein [Micromonospora rhizosphaerae]SCL15312.1 hypothetical protein GA0070624_0685 [Micromonospora rhizosphaerae]
MQEQPPSDPPHREPAASTRRSRSPKATFTPPAAPDPAAPPVRQPEGEDGTGQNRPRRAKAAPAVLFQPPDPGQASPRPTPAEPAPPKPRPASADTPSTTLPAAETIPSNGEGGTTAAGQTMSGGPVPEPREQGLETGQKSPKPKRKAPATKAATAAKKAAPAARKRAGLPPSAASNKPGDPQHTDTVGSVAAAKPGIAEPTGPVSAAAAAPAAGPEAGPAAPTGRTSRAKKAPAPRKSTTRSTTPKKATPAPKAAASTATAPAQESPAANTHTVPVEEIAAEATRTAPVEDIAAEATRTAPVEDIAAEATRTGAVADPAVPSPIASGTVADTAARSPMVADPAAPSPMASGTVEPVLASGVTAMTGADEPAGKGRAETDGPAGKGRAETDVPAVVSTRRPLTDRDQPTPAVPASARSAWAEWRAIGSRVLDHPGFAPELLALAAVEALGPRARDWTERVLDAYPDADADGLARLATRRFVRLAGAGGATAALAGLFAPVAELAVVVWTQADLVLHLAAAYGRDPGHPDRATELLVLTQVHPDADSARAGLEAARAADGPGEQPWPRAAEAAWRLATPLAAQASGWLGLRLASRLLPGAAVLAAAAGDSAAAERLAARAISVYRPARLR